MKDEIVNTRNPLLLGETIAQLLARPPESGRFGIVEGPAGTGKTTTAKMLAKRFGGIYFSVRELESPRSLFVGLLDLLGGWTEELRLHRLHALLMYELERKRWPVLLLDEADRLDKKSRDGVSLLEVVRDVHDRSLSPIILFSISHLARRLANATGGGYEEAFSSRVAAHVRFERASLEDAELLAERLVEDVKFDGDLIAHCVTVSGGSFRPLLGLFAEIEQLAQTAGMRTMSLAKYRQLASFAGMPASPPTRRAGRSSAPTLKGPKAIAS
jgi:Cdc6-like AAA superfamily ATPase